MSVPSEMPFSVEFSDEDVSSLQLVVLGRDLDGPIRHLVTDLRDDFTVNVRYVNENLVHLSIAFFGGDEAVSFLAEEVSDVAFDLGSIDGTLASRRRPIPTRRHQMRQRRQE